MAMSLPSACLHPALVGRGVMVCWLAADPVGGPCLACRPCCARGMSFRYCARLRALFGALFVQMLVRTACMQCQGFQAGTTC
jgi:hypothetical protein